MEIKLTTNQVRPLNKRPYSTQEAWDRHCARMRRRWTIWRVFKIAAIPAIVLVLLSLAALPLSFG
jgi:hypothetical protein